MKTVYNVLDTISNLVFVQAAPSNYVDLESPKVEVDVDVEIDNSPREYVQQPYNLRPRKSINYNA
jgi:hypothetical protein